MSPERNTSDNPPAPRPPGLVVRPEEPAPLAHPYLPGRVRHRTGCGALLERRIPPGDTRERLCCPSCGFIHYLDPKLAAC
ncbi:MAG: zinc ribbon domain-containing protein, partial [Nitrospinota bacterium]